jgi:uncharacterized protein (TIGR02598 family)
MNSFFPPHFRQRAGSVRPADWKLSGFSLVEVTLAMGIIAFALVAVLGLVPPGLSTFRKAVTTSIGTQIVQQVVSDIRQTDFDSLSTQPAWRYFDDQGQEYASVQTTGTGRVIYHVNVQITKPVTLPGGNTSNLARVNIEIVNNPGNKSLTRDAQGNVQEDTGKGIFVSRYAVFIAKNQ